jgi:hypothetical protein
MQIWWGSGRVMASVATYFLTALVIFSTGCGASPPPAADPAKSEKLRTYMKENFSGGPGFTTSWYPHIRDLEVRGDQAIAQTDLTSKPQDREALTGVCRSVGLFVASRTDGQSMGLHRAEVRGATGESLPCS